MCLCQPPHFVCVPNVPGKPLGKFLVYVCLKGLYAGYPNFVGSTQVKAVHEGTIQCSGCTLTFQGSP